MDWGIVLAVLGVVAVLYFIYTRVQESKNKPSGTGSGGGGSNRPPTQKK